MSPSTALSMLLACGGRWASLIGSRSGNVALAASLVLAPGGVGFSALAFDFMAAHTAKVQLQAAADGAALAAARELPLKSTSRSTVDAVVVAYVRANLDPDIALAATESAILDERAGVRVTLKAHVPSVFGGLFNKNGLSPTATAVARLAGGTPLCALALETLDAKSLHLEKQARMIANDCAVVSNSTHSRGITLRDSAELHASMICSAGGAAGKKASFNPEAVTDCPEIRDPLADRPEPEAGGCTHLLPVVVTGEKALSPGVYCGGLIVSKNATATLSPGVYVMKNGPLRVANDATLIGQHVGFYFVGDLSSMRLEGSSKVDLTAPLDGPMAGFLFFADRVLATGALKLRDFVIESNNARTLLGTIYLRDGRLRVAAHAPIADKSAYTVVVARRIEITAGPDFVLNADYDATDVPTPEGVGPRPAQPYLAQ